MLASSADAPIWSHSSRHHGLLRVVRDERVLERVAQVGARVPGAARRVAARSTSASSVPVSTPELEQRLRVAARDDRDAHDALSCVPAPCAIDARAPLAAEVGQVVLREALLVGRRHALLQQLLGGGDGGFDRRRAAGRCGSASSPARRGTRASLRIRSAFASASMHDAVALGLAGAHEAPRARSRTSSSSVLELGLVHLRALLGLLAHLLRLLDLLARCVSRRLLQRRRRSASCRAGSSPRRGCRS